MSDETEDIDKKNISRSGKSNKKSIPKKTNITNKPNLTKKPRSKKDSSKKAKLRKSKPGKTQSKKQVKIVLIIIAGILVLSGALWGTKIYLDYRKILYEEEKYSTSNFEDKSFNYLKTPDEGEVYPGGLICYNIFYKNTGMIEVKDFSIEADVPEYCKPVEKYIQKYSYKYSDKKIIFKIGSVDVSDGGNIDLTFKVDYPLDNGTEIASPQIEFKYFKEDALIEKSGYFSKKISASSKLEVKSSPNLEGSILFIEGFEEGRTKEVKYGDEIEYRVYIYNSGDMNAEDIEIIAGNLENLTILEDESSDFNIEGNNISLKIPELKVGSAKLYSFFSKVNSDAENGSVIVPKLEIKYSDITVQKDAPVCIVRLFPSFESSYIGLIDTSSEGTYSGDIIDVSVGVTNTGDIDANNVAVNLVLSNLFVLNEGVSSWNIGSLGVGKTATFSTSIRVVEGITKDCYASCRLKIASDEAESFESSNYSLLVSGSRPFTRNYIPILEFHGIVPEPQSRYEVSTGAFEYLLSTLRNYGYQTITFMDLLSYLDYGKALPEKPIIITSDDGYQSIYTYAFPILKKYGYKMTVFLITGYMGDSEANRRMSEFDFNVKGIPHRPMLIWPEIVQMSRYGCEFQSHTWSHGIIRNMHIEDSLKELVQSKSDIEIHTGKPVLFVAWPHGATSSQILSLLPQAGYRGAVNAGGGIEDVRSINIYAIRRVPMLREISPLAYVEYLKLE